MHTGVELSLSSLLPTVSPLPDELITLATSLLAQSRSKAATLKPEEEIGRTYACCHIACQRLGHRLALEIAKPTPPVKPKVYTKLHTYLNSVLKTNITPRRAATRLNVDGTPSKVVVTSSKSTRGGGQDILPVTASPAEKRVLATTPSRKRKAETQEVDRIEDRTLNANDPVVAESSSTAFGVEDKAEDSDEVRTTTTPTQRPAKTPLRRQEKHGMAGNDDLGPAGLLPGLGTMFQPAVDWLSEERRADYTQWKKAILREAALVESRG